MKNFISFSVIITSLLFVTSFTIPRPLDEWVPLFDGKSLNNWKVGANAGTFTVENGMIVAHGPVAHLFYGGG